ncbi:MAG: uracil-DNA glycosylase [Syntrophobacteraceae bacterium]|nr:uracil-DNA glycosylase [Desulfobacteraceae bacterium]
MEPPREDRREIPEPLEHLKWLLEGLRMGGIKDLPRRRPAVARAAPEIPDECTPTAPHGEDLEGIRRDLGECTRCRLHSGRSRIVFGEGSQRAGLVFVGEGPGFEEDRQGRPFVGRAGRLLDRMIGAMDFRREDVYICNVVKCRPPENRTPEAEEVDACSPFLMRQLTALQPRAICTLGACASQTVLGTRSPISRLRGKIHRWRGVPVVCTFHPAYLLRNPAQKAQTWLDLLEARRVLAAGKEEE